MNKFLKGFDLINDLAFNLSNVGIHVMTEYAGHVGLISVRVYKDGWVKDAEPTDKFTWYVSGALENGYDECDRCIDCLMKLQFNSTMGDFLKSLGIQ